MSSAARASERIRSIPSLDPSTLRRASSDSPSRLGPGFVDATPLIRRCSLREGRAG